MGMIYKRGEGVLDRHRSQSQGAQRKGVSKVRSSPKVRDADLASYCAMGVLLVLMK